MTEPAERSSRGGGGRAHGRILLVIPLVLAVVAAAALAIGSDDVLWLRLGIVAALWAGLTAAIFLARRPREVSGEVDVDELRERYRLELEREIAARREYELTVERDLRREIAEETRSDIDMLRDELSALRRNLEVLVGGEVLVERVALRADARRMSAVEEGQGATAALPAPPRPRDPTGQRSSQHRSEHGSHTTGQRQRAPAASAQSRSSRSSQSSSASDMVRGAGWAPDPSTHANGRTNGLTSRGGRSQAAPEPAVASPAAASSAARAGEQGTAALPTRRQGATRQHRRGETGNGSGTQAMPASPLTVATAASNVAPTPNSGERSAPAMSDPAVSGTGRRSRARSGQAASHRVEAPPPARAPASSPLSTAPAEPRTERSSGRSRSQPNRAQPSPLSSSAPRPSSQSPFQETVGRGSRASDDPLFGDLPPADVDWDAIGSWEPQPAEPQRDDDWRSWGAASRREHRAARREITEPASGAQPSARSSLGRHRGFEGFSAPRTRQDPPTSSVPASPQSQPQPQPQPRSSPPPPPPSPSSSQHGSIPPAGREPPPAPRRWEAPDEPTGSHRSGRSVDELLAAYRDEAPRARRHRAG